MLVERAAEFRIDFPLLRGRVPLWLDWNRDGYEKIEEVSANATHKELVRRFLEGLLISVAGPLDTKLHANYPNPFNPETWIPYQLAEDRVITIRIYDVSGRIVRTLFTGHQTAGYYLNRSEAAYWNGKMN